MDTGSWGEQGIFMLALPDSTLELVTKLSLKMSKQFPDVISEALMLLAEKELTEEQPNKKVHVYYDENGKPMTTFERKAKTKIKVKV